MRVRIKRVSFFVCGNVDDQECRARANVYKPHTTSDRHVLWQELRDFKSTFTGVWCVAADFNLTRFQSERKGFKIS